MKPHLTLLAAGLTLLLTGCAHWTRKPAIVAPNETTRYSTASFENDYKDYVAEKDASKSTPLRDRMIQRIRVDIDSWYFNFESDLFAHRAGFDTGADVVELGLAGAASLTNGERAKTILASILTAAKGSRLSIDKNWFREKTTETLIHAMRAERARLLFGINDKMSKLPANAYSFEEAWADLVAYFQAGTLEGGLLALSATAGDQVVAAKDKAEVQNEERIGSLDAASEESIATTRELTEALNKLFNTDDRAGAESVAAALGLSAVAEPDPFKRLDAYLRALRPSDAPARKQAAAAFNLTP
jgi:hypothetical protein